MIIAGIGSRKTPLDMLMRAEQIGMLCAVRGHMGRSGGAVGFDTAFERGFIAIEPGYFMRFDASSNSEWFRHAARYHPAWDACSATVKRLHARNSAIICGPGLDSPVHAIVCWTPGGAVTGGTGQGLRIAEDMRIPVFNLATMQPWQLWHWLDRRERRIAGSIA